MGVLQDAIAQAHNSTISTSDFLRTCQVVAYRLKNEPLKQWVKAELGGFGDAEEVPDYREIGLHLKGDFLLGYMHRTNATVPVGALPASLQAQALAKKMREPLAELDALGRGARSQSLRTTCIPPELFGAIEIFTGAQTLDLWCEVSAQALIGIVDQVRSRALTLLLELEAEDPNAGEPGQSDVTQERVTQLVQNIFYSQNLSVAAAAGAVANQRVVVPADLDSLMRWARGAGIPEELLDQLPAAIADDGHTIGRRVRGWVKSAAKGAAGIGRDVATGVIEAEVKRYLGLP